MTSFGDWARTAMIAAVVAAASTAAAAQSGGTENSNLQEADGGRSLMEALSKRPVDPNAAISRSLTRVIAVSAPTADVALTFDTNSTALSPTAERFLAQFAAAYVDSRADWRMEIAGHTDATGSAEYNMRLSERRAEAVASFLVRWGVPSVRISTIGYGETRLKIDTQAAEAANRRVQFTNLGR